MLRDLRPLDDVLLGARFVRRLPGFLRRPPITVEAARGLLAQRLERREADFLALVKRAVFEHPASPYRALLGLAGCEYGDLERLVRHGGVEGALETLLRHGVYVTAEEYKQERPLVRGSTTVPVGPARLRNPLAARDLLARTSASRGVGSEVLLDLAHIRDSAVDACLWFAARGGLAWRKAQWQVPGSGVIARILELASLGAPPDRWFSFLDPSSAAVPRRYRWSVRALRWGSALAGVRLPRPQHVSAHDPTPIGRWMASVLAGGQVPHLHTFASAAVRVCQAARQAGIDLRGAAFTVTGEPLTATRLAEIRAAGAQAGSRYGTVEYTAIGLGCLQPDGPDEVHVVRDLYAVMQAGAAERRLGLPRQALFLTTIRPTAPLIALNVGLGDRAHVGRRRCECPLEALGWTLHLHGIESYEKLTAGGLTFSDTKIIQILEDVLPARFGGGPTDYQLVEEETPEGQARLRLLVHPDVGRVDPSAVTDAFLTALGRDGETSRVLSLVWRDARVLQVERRPPLATRSGKILHLHVDRRPSR